MKSNIREAKRTTLLAAALAMAAIIATASPALARRDPGAGTASASSGMGLYNYGPRPPAQPRIGQAGLNNQYADGMNLYQYVRSNPVVNVDPMGERIIFISGLGQFPNKKFAEAMAQSVKRRLWRSALVKRGKSQQIVYGSDGGGGQGPEDALRNAYRQFVKDKEASECSLEQFVVVGFSDGATAAYRLLKAGKEFKTDYPPAYIGLMDLVRLNYNPLNIKWSVDNTPNISSNKPKHTRVENWYQTTGNASANLVWVDRGFKGSRVIGADKNTNVNVWHFGREDMPGQRKDWEAKANLGHGGLYKDKRVRAEVINAVGLWYVQKAREEARRMKKPTPWVMKEGDHW